MKISGHMDLCGPELIEGWLYSDAWDGEPIVLQVYLDERLIGECRAERFRQDLQEAGFGDGRCGFSFAVPTDAAFADFSSVKLRLVDSPVYMLPSDDTSMAPRAEPLERAETKPSGRAETAILSKPYIAGGQGLLQRAAAH